MNTDVLLGFAIGGSIAISCMGITLKKMKDSRDSWKKRWAREHKEVEQYLRVAYNNQEQAKHWETLYRHTKNEAIRWERLCRENKPQTGVAFKSDTAKEMIKFAMTQAHPDKPNGSNERFVKYREIYEKVCK